MAKKTAKPVPAAPSPEHVREAFYLTANAIAGDFFASAAEMGEPEEAMDREFVADYLEMHGGPHGKATADYLAALPSMKAVNKFLNEAGVPKDYA